ncbi:hypothetical protein AMR72_02455 [Flavobacterium psychrophilum]|nr:hypothetical protein AMR72_02455 [Flavobacterium psychrophilum]AOE51480.1 hypothetical protein ALW18_02455 [Flavobacterium psychrophilum]
MPYFKKNVLILVSVFVNYFSYGQSSISSKEALILKNIRSNPEIVLKLVREVLSSDEKLADTTYANICIYIGFSHSQLNTPDSAIYYFKKSLAYSEKYPKHKAKAYLNLGTQYRKMTNYDIALDYLSRSEILNRELKNKSGTAMVYGEIASIYNQQGNFNNSIGYLLKSLDIFKELKKPNLINPVMQRLASTYMGTKNYQFAADMYVEVLAYFKDVNLKNYYVTLVNYGQCLLLLNKYQEAEITLNAALPGLLKYNDVESIAMANSWLGAIAFKKGKIDKGEELYDKALITLYDNKSYSLPVILGHYITNLNQKGRYKKAEKVFSYSEKYLTNLTSNVETLAELEEQKAITYKNINAKDKSIASLEKALTIKNKINYNDNQAVLRKLQARYQNTLQREKNLSLKTNNRLLKAKVENETQQKIIVTVLFLATLGIIVIGYHFYLAKKKLISEKLKTIILSKETATLQYEQEQQSTKQLKKSLLEKQADLVSGAMKLAIVQENINEILFTVKKNQNNLDTTFLTSKLETLIKQEDYWEVFEKKFSEIHPYFTTHLSEAYPTLNKTDLFFASLLKLKLPYKEIGKLMAISPESVIKKKYRLKKKMKIESEDEFEKVFLEL